MKVTYIVNWQGRAPERFTSIAAVLRAVPGQPCNGITLKHGPYSVRTVGDCSEQLRTTVADEIRYARRKLIAKAGGNWH